MITLSRPSIRRREMDAVLSCMVTDSLGPGTLADELVAQVSSYLNLAGGIALRERVRALGVALDHLRLAPGTGVVLDCLVPHGYHRVITDRGLVPIYVDVDERSLCINAERVAEAVARGEAAARGEADPGGGADAGGEAAARGEADAGGEVDAGGEAAARGEVVARGEATAGGESDASDSAPARGDADAGGEANTGGEATARGEVVARGEATAGGESDASDSAPARGDADTGGEAAPRGDDDAGGDAPPGDDRDAPSGDGRDAPSGATPHGGVRVGAIITRATLGFVPDMEAIAELGVPIVEDVSEGIGGNTGESRVGGFGRFVIVGMEPDAVVTAGGGTVLLASGKGDRNALRRFARTITTDALLQDMNAALGITQIKEIEKFIARRAEVASVYARAIMRGRHGTPVQPGEAQNVHLVFPVLVEGSVSEVVAYARKKGVECRPAFEHSVIERYGRPAHAAPGEGDDADEADRESVLLDERDFPVARALLLRCLQFPLYPSLTAKEVATVERVLSTLP